MAILRPEFIGSEEDKKRAFAIGISAHNQVEAKFNHGAIKERAFQFERADYVLEIHPDIYYPTGGGLVVEIKSLRYFVEYLEESVMQLSAYVALLGATRGLFIIYQGKMEYPSSGEPTFKVISSMPSFVPLLPKTTILPYLDLRAEAMLAELRKDGKLPPVEITT